MARTLPHLGRLFFAISLLGFGIQNFYYTCYLKGLELTPEWAPWHTFWAYLDGAILITGGIAILLRLKIRWAAAAAAAVYFASVIFLRIPRIPLAIHDVAERTVLFEPIKASHTWPPSQSARACCSD